MPVSLLLIAGCLAGGGGAFPRKAPVIPPTGGIYTQVKAPLTIRAKSLPTGNKSGQSVSSYFCLPFFGPALSISWGDASLAKAKANGNIRSVDYADYEMFQVLGIYGQMKVNAYGK